MRIATPVLIILLTATSAFAQDLLQRPAWDNNLPLVNNGPGVQTFQMQDASGATVLRGQSDGMGGHYLTGPSGGPVGQIRGDGTVVGPSGGYLGRIDNN